MPISIYFDGPKHRANFEKLCEKFPNAQHPGNGSYRSACYIAALPEIFKCFTLEKQRSGPFDWFIHLTDPDESNNDKIRAKHEKEYGASLAPLTSGTNALCEIACSLWNSRPCDLSDITDMDRTLYHVVLQALELRRRQQTIDYATMPIPLTPDEERSEWFAVEGFASLTADQKKFIMEMQKKHLSAWESPEMREKYSVRNVAWVKWVPEENCFHIRYRDADWYHYELDGAWW